MSFLIVVGALAFLMMVAYRGYSVILTSTKIFMTTVRALERMLQALDSNTCFSVPLPMLR